MIINHNMNSMIAYNRANAMENKKNGAMEKLSSGLRLNSASDDAAGTSISEKMKAQIRGLEKASENIQNGISLIQTAEAGLGSIQNPNLIRMKELIEQALNGTLNQEDRMKIQVELDNIKGGIDDIANYTEFNTIKVLSPPSYEKTVPGKWTPGKADIVFVIDRTGSMGPKINQVKNNLDGFVNKMTDNGIDVNLGLITYGDVNDSEPLIKKAITSNLSDFKNYLNSITPMGGGDINESGLEGIADPTSGALSYALRSDSAKQIIFVTDAPVHDNGIGGDGKASSPTLTIDAVANDVKTKGITLTLVTDNSNKSSLQPLYVTTGGEYIDINSNFQDQLSAYASKIMLEAGCNEEIETDKMPTLQLQVGANAGEQFQVELFDARTKSLEIHDVSVESMEEAEKALNKVNNAMEIVSQQRSKFGAYQNALEHVGNNVNNYAQNITSAQSRIADVDMAKEMIEVTKSSILEESAQSMLKQAEKIPEGILNLMRMWQQGGSL